MRHEKSRRRTSQRSSDRVQSVRRDCNTRTVGSGDISLLQDYISGPSVRSRKLRPVCSKSRRKSLSWHTNLEIRGNDRMHSPPLLSVVSVVPVVPVMSMRHLLHLPVPAVRPTRRVHDGGIRTRTRVEYSSSSFSLDRARLGVAGIRRRGGSRQCFCA